MSRSPAFCRRLRYGYDGATYFLFLFCAYLYISAVVVFFVLVDVWFLFMSNSYLGVALSVCLGTAGDVRLTEYFMKLPLSRCRREMLCSQCATLFLSFWQFSLHYCVDCGADDYPLLRSL